MPPPPRPPPGDDAIVLAAIYERDFKFVWRGLRRLGIPPRDLPDVTHDVFIVVLRRLPSYDRARPFRPWLFGVLYRVAADHLDRARNRLEVLDELTSAVDAQPRPDLLTEAREEWEIVDRALDDLSLGHRAVLVMHDFMGYRGHEVARILEIPMGTVYSRLTTARALFLERAERERGRNRTRPRRRKTVAETPRATSPDAQ